MFVHLHKNQHTKLDVCVFRCLFLGYGLHNKGYKCLDPTTNKTYITMDIVFLESESFFSLMVSNSTFYGEFMNKELNWYLVVPSSIVEKKQIGEHESEVEGVIHDEPIQMKHLNITEVESEEDL